MRKKTRDTPSQRNNRLKGILTTVAVTLTVVLLLGSMSVLADTGRGGSGESGTTLTPDVPGASTFAGTTLKAWTFDEGYTLNFEYNGGMKISDGIEYLESYGPDGLTSFLINNGALEYKSAECPRDAGSYINFGYGLEKKINEFSYFTIDLDVTAADLIKDAAWYFGFSGEREEYCGVQILSCSSESGFGYDNNLYVDGEKKLKVLADSFHMTYVFNSEGDCFLYINGDFVHSWKEIFGDTDTFAGLQIKCGYMNEEPFSMNKFFTISIDNVIFNYFEPGYTGAITEVTSASNLRDNPDTVLGGCMEN